MCVDKLELIKKGDIAGAKALGLEECSYDEESDVESMGGTTKLPEEKFLNLELPNWTCLQYKEAISALDVLFKAKTSRKCSRCEKKNLKITCPSVGLFHAVCLLLSFYYLRNGQKLILLRTVLCMYEC